MFLAEVTEAETAPLAFVIIAACFVLALVGTVRSIRANSSRSSRPGARRSLWISSLDRPQSCAFALSSGTEITHEGTVQPFSGLLDNELAAAIEVYTSGTRLRRTSALGYVGVNGNELQPGQSIELAAIDRIVLKLGGSTSEFQITSGRPR